LADGLRGARRSGLQALVWTGTQFRRGDAPAHRARASDQWCGGTAARSSWTAVARCGQRPRTPLQAGRRCRIGTSDQDPAAREEQ